MAKKKPMTRKSNVISKIKAPNRPKWMRVLRLVTMIVLSILMVFAIVGHLYKYYHLISKHR